MITPLKPCNAPPEFWVRDPHPDEIPCLESSVYERHGMSELESKSHSDGSEPSKQSADGASDSEHDHIPYAQWIRVVGPMLQHAEEVKTNPRAHLSLVRLGRWICE